MKNKKDQALVVVVSGLTSNQAGKLRRDMVEAKQRYAPKGKGTIATGRKEQVGKMIQGKETKRITHKS